MVIPAEPKWDTPERIYDDYNNMEKDFAEGTIHPNDLKKAMVNHINNLLEPVREYFKNNKHAKNLAKLVKNYRK